MAKNQGRNVETHIVKVEVLRPNPAVKNLEVAVAIVEQLRDLSVWGDVPIAHIRQVRQLVSRAESALLLIRHQLLGAE